MKKLIVILVLAVSLSMPVNAMEFSAPEVPDSGKQLIPAEPETFAEGVWSILKEAIAMLQPALSAAAGACVQVIAAVLALSLLNTVTGGVGQSVRLAGAILLTLALVSPSHTLINLGVQTVKEISEYGKLLVPVLTAALAAQGGAGSSAALYAGTVLFDSILSAVLSGVVAPLIYVYICLSVASAAIGEPLLVKLKDF